ncbi:hypothetical protein D3C86_1437060 [compost metagenome]
MLVDLALERGGRAEIQPVGQLGRQGATLHPFGEAVDRGQEFVDQGFGQRPCVVDQDELAAEFRFVAADKQGDKQLEVGASRQAERGEPLLAVHDEALGSLGKVDRHATYSAVHLLKADALGEGDDDGVRQNGRVSFQIVADLADMAGDLGTLEAAQGSVLVTADAIDLSELEHLSGGGREGQDVMFGALARPGGEKGQGRHAAMSLVEGRASTTALKAARLWMPRRLLRLLARKIMTSMPTSLQMRQPQRRHGLSARVVR